MRHLRKRDKHNKLTLVDIQSPSFAQTYPHLDWHALNARIHGQLPDGPGAGAGLGCGAGLKRNVEMR